MLRHGRLHLQTSRFHPRTYASKDTATQSLVDLPHPASAAAGPTSRGRGPDGFPLAPEMRRSFPLRRRGAEPSSTRHSPTVPVPAPSIPLAPPDPARNGPTPTVVFPPIPQLSRPAPPFSPALLARPSNPDPPATQPGRPPSRQRRDCSDAPSAVLCKTGSADGPGPLPD